MHLRARADTHTGRALVWSLPTFTRFLFRRRRGRGGRGARGKPGSGVLLAATAVMAGLGSLILRPWIRELVLGLEALSGPRPGQLLEVLQEAEAPGPSRAPDALFFGAALLVSDGTHSIRCLLTRRALDTSDWEKEFGFRGTEGRLLLLQDCGVRVQVSERGAVSDEAGLEVLLGLALPDNTLESPLNSPLQPAEFYLQVDRFSLLPTEQPLIRVAGCNQDPDVQKKLCDCLEEHLSESTSSNPGLTLSQLLDEVQEDQEHRRALVRLAESCLMLAGCQTTPTLTRWATSHCRATGEAVYTVPSLCLCISQDDQQILSSLGPGPELPTADPALQDLSLTLPSSSSSSPGSSGTPPELHGHLQSEESSASISLLPALSLAAPDPVQRDSSQALPAICSTPGPFPPCSPHPSSLHPSHVPNSPFLSCTPSLLPFGRFPSPHKAHVTRAQKPTLELKELGLPLQNQQPPPRTNATKEALDPSPVWDPPKRHRDGCAFQYEYEPPCTSLCARVQAARLPPELVAWALHFVTEPSPESELTGVRPM
ncbi:adrenocortical dysplasia protein homolog isoform X2 [Loxodonta africana]|uniref:adrenocortical dysplasia protein homolog isoform X2 n=1 Tax=Loxodonta africana TaxID=9785 RepID=UPI000C814220|nr:adrenocortical dysplasia protein homolog isoform X2 [Loxodonta africana]